MTNTYLITLETVRDTWNACYDSDRLAALYDRPYTPMEVLTNSHGAWADVPSCDRLWTVLRSGVLPDVILRKHAIMTATRALKREEDAGRKPDARSYAAIETAKRHVDGTATDDELASAYAAAYAARDAAATAYASAAAYAAAARDAAYAAAAAAYAYAAYAARDAARDAAYAAYAARDAAYAAYAAATATRNERDQQLADLITLLTA